MTRFVFDTLRPRAYRAVLADPPWAYRVWSGGDTTPHRTKVEPYPVMSLDDLKRLPVGFLCAPDCVLFLWCISSHMNQAFALGEAWGFTYKSKAFEWFKQTKDGLGFKMGMGHWTRQESETVLLFTRGSPKRKSRGVRSTIASVPREHSRKPDEVYRRIEALVAGPYCELFAKYRQPGWDGWGNEFPDSGEGERMQLTYWLNVFGVPEDHKGGYRLCELGHPVVQRNGNEFWPYCDEKCIPY